MYTIEKVGNRFQMSALHKNVSLTCVSLIVFKQQLTHMTEKMTSYKNGMFHQSTQYKLIKILKDQND